MTLISIRERPAAADGTNAVVCFDNEGEYPITITPPFAEEDEQRLEWYFERHLRFPFSDQVKAQQAATSIVGYGEALFNQVFANRHAFGEYKAALQAGISGLAFEVAGSPEFHKLHWEALKDPDMPQPFALEAPIVRKNLRPQVVRATVRSSPTINVLLVTARPSGERDVAYRTISRPLVEALHQANVRVRIDMVRPGTYKELERCLQTARQAVEPGEAPGGYYHVVHFDVHGSVMTYEQAQKNAEANRLVFQARYGRPDLEPYEGHKAFLFLEGEHPGQFDPVEASELAGLLITEQVPIAILNACQSGKQIGDTETSLGSHLMQAGVQLVLAMGYSVTVSAAELLMRRLYRELFSGSELGSAIRLGRRELANSKGRRAYFNQTIDLEDWLLPVVYQNRAVSLHPRAFTPAEHAAFYTRKAQEFAPPEPAYGFVGRDLDILQIERRILTQHNMLLVRGMGGAGKTTLLRHLGAWWQTTGLVEQVWSFGYEERAWTRQQILDAIARQVYSESDYKRLFQPMNLDAQQAMLTDTLRGTRHLLILDNLESITGAQLAIQHTLPPEEQQALHRWLKALAGGKTLVLLGSRGGEEWLAAGTFGSHVYELPGLDEEAASALADKILTRAHASAAYRTSNELRQIMKLLNGYPLALEVVLANLQRQTPAEVLAALQTGDVHLDTGDPQDKTRSILRCIDYSHSNLSPAAQTLLTCLAPFTSVINIGLLPSYTELLRAQPTLAGLPFEQWDMVIREAQNWGLLTSHPMFSGYLSIQPTLPYFLRSRLNDPGQNDLRVAVETAFRAHYDGMGRALYQLAEAKEPDKRQLGLALIGLEYENLSVALNLVLAAQRSILNTYLPLSVYLDSTQDQQRGLALGEQVLRQLEKFSTEKLTGMPGGEFVSVIDKIAFRQLSLKHYGDAERSYQKALSLHNGLTILSESEKALGAASIYHQLGMVAQEQRQWQQAEQHYQQALQICVEYNDRYSQARTYHQLGMVAQEQRQWQQAEQHYQQALQICVEYNDRYNRARIYGQLGILAQEHRQWQQAEQHYQQALQIYIEYNDRYSQASSYHHLGWVAEEQRQWEQAEQYYQQALAIKVAYNDRYSQASSYHQLGILVQKQRQWQQAEQYYKHALDIFVAYNDRHSQASSYHQLGCVAEERRQWQQAEQHYLYALEIWVEYNDTHYTGMCLRNLARLWQLSGDATLPAAVAAVLGVAPAEAEEVLRKAAG